MGLTDDLRTNLTGSTDMDGTSEPANSEHHQQHNLANAYSIAAEAAHGTTAHVLQTIYDNGTGPSHSEIVLDDTADGIVIKDAASPISPTSLFKVVTNGGTSLFGVASDGITASQGVSLSGGITSAAAGSNSERYGASATAAGADALAVGKSATASGNQSTAIGISTTATGVGATSLGQSADATADSATALGKNAQATAAAATSTGEDSNASASNTTAVGKGAAASGVAGSAFGASAAASGGQDVAVGYQASTAQLGGIAIGRNSSCPVSSSEADSIAIGNAATASGSASICAGSGATVTGSAAICIGGSSTVAGADGIGIGNTATASAAQTTAIGDNCTASAVDAIALGGNSSATHARAVAIGQGATSATADDFILGNASHNVKVPGDFDVDGTTTVDGLTSAGDIVTDGANITAKKTTLVLNTVWNTTSTDAAGARLGSYGFFGQTAAAAVHALASMSASHSGSAADQRGKYAVGVNDGGDGLTPTERLSIDYTGGVTHVLDAGARFKLELSTGASADFDVDALTGDRTITVPDRPITLGCGPALIGNATDITSSTTNQIMIGSTAKGVVVPFDGQVVSLTGAADGLPSVGHSCTMTIWKNGSASGDTVTVDNTKETDSQSGNLTFSAGDRLQMKATTNGSWATKSIDAAIYISQD